ncbi:nicotinic acid mononucleotide adenylyltransferase [Acidihalobacter yilgarnensis]|uniref:Probable nicotinate-nucleotide adenylyltransferase n=1 Tax=Acidihalobacter yilgarnensis TaxID=2819280 RepID=A0A1D8ITG3_9GAMM|nr:nicotinate-nucleotide adenylyltransferase [Acidihalobacter yilgarnensis]AOU99713.1 nicotinic acid mononucleotide adenylyltransferase [Acidihalobacter yilgarnensis]
MIGLLGGTFDPIHYGHLRVALEIREALGLDEVRFLPCGIPPHRGVPGASAESRAALVALALADVPEFVLDRRELMRSGPSYTYDTLCSLREDFGAERPFCLILGADAFGGLPGWHRAGELLDLAHIIVARRPGEVPKMAPPLMALLGERITDCPADLRSSAGGRVMWIDVTQLDISATAIREQLRCDGNPRFLIPDAVLEAIRTQGLYGREQTHTLTDSGVT